MDYSVLVCDADRDRISDLVRARHALLAIETLDEARVTALLADVAARLGLTFLEWRPHRGIRSYGSERGGVPGTEDLVKALAFVEEGMHDCLYAFYGAEDDLGGSLARGHLKEVHRRLTEHKGLLVFVSPTVSVAADIDPLLARIELAAPSAGTIRAFIGQVLADVRKNEKVQVELGQEDLRKIIHRLSGLPFEEMRRILSVAMVSDGKLSALDLPTITDARRRAVERTGALELIDVSRSLEDVAGLSSLKAWIRERKRAFQEPEEARKFGVSPPRGILLAGVQGCGKSLAAKVIAHEWGAPLLRFDPAQLYQKYIGETEKGLKRALAAAESMAPAVLWIDELEKAFGHDEGSDGGVSVRVLGSFLSWLQEHQSQVFVAATANELQKLPPELLRKGRFDEIFFIDLPDGETRKAVFAVHIAQRRRSVTNFDLDLLSLSSDGFSHAEIEQAIESALQHAFATGGEITTESLVDEIGQTVPLSVTMAERVTSLREWARSRAVPAK